METLEEFFNKAIYHWVGKHFGSQEADDPSWNIEALSKYLAKETERREQKVFNLEPYELTVLLPEEVDSERVVSDILSKINKFDGSIASKEDDGVKRLAYAIQNRERARYIYMNIHLPKDAPVKLSTWLNTNDHVLRYLLVKQDRRR